MTFTVVADGILKSRDSSIYVAITTARRLAKEYSLVTIEDPRGTILDMWKNSKLIKE